MRLAASRLELVVSAALALTVVSFVLGSSSITDLTQLGLRLRWLCLFALVPLTAWLYRSRPHLRGVPAPAVYAATAVLVGLAFASALWSVRPGLTLARATSLLLLLTVTALLGLTAAGRAETTATFAKGLLAGAGFVAFVGAFLVLVDRDLAVQPSSPGTPWRFRGLGQNPNTVSLLAGIVLPLALWQLLEARTAKGRALAAATAVVFYGTIVTSGSQGALAATFIGMLVLAIGVDWERARRAALATGAVGAFAVGLGFSQLPGLTPPIPRAATVAVGTLPSVVTTTVGGVVTTRTTPAAGVTTRTGGGTATGGTATGPGGGTPKPKPGTKTTPGTKPKPAPAPAPVPVVPPPKPRPGGSRLEDEIGSPSSGTLVDRRTLFGGSGRGLAWQGALEQGAERPVTGYGFGTEERTFVDRWYSFNGSRPENSVIGIFLQLGAAGVAALAAVAAAVALTAVRALRRLSGPSRRLAAALAGAVAAGTVLALVQSYVYSVGNIGAVPLWASIFLLAAVSAVAGAERRA